MRSFPIGTVLGFPIAIHASWLLIFLLVVHTFAFEVLPADLPHLSLAWRVVVAVVTALLFFASLLAHEMAHSIVARRNGIRVVGITLFIFGGIAQLAEEPRSAGEELRIAIVGPAASLLIGVLFWSLLLAVEGIEMLLVPAVICVYLAYLNWVLAIFNMLPAFPMDGGRIVRAAVWRWTGSPLRATKVAAATGEVFALSLIAWGAWRFLHEDRVGGVWMAMIGGFVFATAHRTRRHAAYIHAPSRRGARAIDSRLMYVIPNDNLPPGFGDRIEDPPADPPEPRPAATAVLMRDGAAGPELLLLRRHRASGFVPGAWVFPGGRVDAADADAELLVHSSAVPGEGPEAAYWFAVVREVFEETGVLLARDETGACVPDSGRSSGLAGAREALMTDSTTLLSIVREHDLTLDLDDVVYCAHWITPVAEPRRYDTRFFLARLPDGCETSADPREMTDSIWLTPDAALESFAAGRLPMVFPTVRTIEALRGYPSVNATLDAFREAEVEPVLPRLVRTPEGVGIVVD